MRIIGLCEVRGRNLREVFYDEAGEETEVIDLWPGCECAALNIPIDQ